MKYILFRIFRLWVNRLAKNTLKSELGRNEIKGIINALWSHYNYLRNESKISESTLGARIMIQLAIMSRAFYEVLQTRGFSESKSITIFYNIAWKIYKKMGGFVWTLTKFRYRKNVNRLQLATQIFRQFPFSTPSYLWQDVKNENSSVVSFNCHKCPVAEYFKTHNLSNFCSETWCELDFPLAHKWQSSLIRNGSIASGAGKCEFKFIANTKTNPNHT